MAAQAVLPFKSEVTKERMTAHAGPALFGELVHAPASEGLAAVHRKALKQALKRDKRRRYTLDIDATQILVEKQAARRAGIRPGCRNRCRNK